MSLTEQIRAIETRFGDDALRPGMPHAHEACGVLPTNWAEVDAALGGGLAIAALHEWFGIAEERHEGTEARRHGGAEGRKHEGREARRNKGTEAQGHAEEGRGGAELRRSGAWTPPLLPLVHLVRQAMGAAGVARRAVWIGRRCFPYGGVLLGPRDDRRMLEHTAFVIADRPDDRLWAVDLALRCPAIGVVVADGSGFDMAATRRLQLVARAHRTPAFLVRPPGERDRLSAAQTRWLVGMEEGREARRHEGTQGWEDEANTLNPRWRVELLRCKGQRVDDLQRSEAGSRTWTLEWDRGQGVVRVLTPLAGATGQAGLSTRERRFRQA